MVIRPDEVMIVNNRLSQVGLSFSVGSKRGRSAVFECRCGKRIVAICKNVKRGKSRSCGCLRSEVSSRKGKLSRRHGMTRGDNPKKHTVIYTTWTNMKTRCLNPADRGWKHYGGRGINVCDRWKNSFEAFLADMGEPQTGLSIDRIDVNGNYEPGNCRWATSKQQHRNRTDNRLITANGKTQCVSSWAEETGIHKTTLRQRANNGWTGEATVNTPVRHRPRKSIAKIKRENQERKRKTNEYHCSNPELRSRTNSVSGRRL